jgi:outer membrane protein assembly factor BamD
MPLKAPRPPARKLAPALIAATLLALASSGCMLRKHANTNPLASVKSAQPDKILYDIAMSDMDKGKYTVARLNLETLLNTYPDSEYLARAKMAIADSWYRQGGAEGMAQAEAQYKDFITFFPAMKEASEAQLKIAKIHFDQLQKPDRDPTQADRAQAELRTFLLNYPDSPLRPQALQMLRSTQEVLAEREYRIGQFYLDRAHQGDYPDYRAAQSRLEATLQRYPLYSQGDVVTSELAHSYLTTSNLYEGASKLEPNVETRSLFTANAEADRRKAVDDFSRLVTRYPLSPLTADAKKELGVLHVPVPTPSAEAIAFNKHEIEGRGQAPDPGGLSGWFGLKAMWTGRPETEIARADKVGSPSLTEPQLAEAEPIPGLQELIHRTMVATGAIRSGGSPAGATAGDPVGASAAATAHVQTQPATNKPAPLAFQDVPVKGSQGADTLPTNTPQAMTGSNDNDPNARPAAAADPNVVLTPNELDIESQEQLLAAQIHRDVPAPVAELKKRMQQQQETQAKLLQKIREEQAKQEKSKGTKAATPAGGGKSVPHGI